MSIVVEILRLHRMSKISFLVSGSRFVMVRDVLCVRSEGLQIWGLRIWGLWCGSVPTSKLQAEVSRLVADVPEGLAAGTSK